MLTLRRILLPTDHSPCADRAFAHAAFLAERHGAELHVLRVVPVTGTEPGSGRYEAPASVRCIDVTRRATSVADEIVRVARDMDLVVMGTHGRRGIVRIAIGSTTEQVVRQADCPVLTVGLDADRAGPASVARMLVPVDFSDSSAPALAVADELAALYGATVDVLHCAFVPNMPEIYGIGLQFEGTAPDLVSRAGEALRSLAERWLAPERLGEVVVRIGPPAPTILEEAARSGAGLVVMPSHGRTGLERLAAGSVAEGVIRRAPCAVFVVKSFGRIPLPAGAVQAPEPRPALDLVPTDSAA